MRAIIQRVKKANLYIDDNLYSNIGQGLLVFLAVKETDTENDLNYMIKKTLGLRIFEDDQNKMNLSIKDVEGEIMIVSQFTLYGDARKGNRPSFIESAKGDFAVSYYERFVDAIKQEISNTQTGVFGADMQIELINDGPVTIQLDSEKIY